MCYVWCLMVGLLWLVCYEWCLMVGMLGLMCCGRCVMVGMLWFDSHVPNRSLISPGLELFQKQGMPAFLKLRGSRYNPILRYIRNLILVRGRFG